MHIVITGASSGIGQALALRYAAPGVRLSLLGRDAARLAVVAAQARMKGAEAEEIVADVTQAELLATALLRLDEAQPVDVLIANAGVSAGSGIHGETPDQAKRIFSINVDGVLNTVLPLLLRMMARGRGQIGIMSSLAGLRGLPSAPAYSASKAAVKAYGEALRGYAGRHGVGVSVIMPGYIKTPLTDNNPFPMPLLMQPEKAAGIIAGGLKRNKPRIGFPLPLYLLVWFVACLSPRLTDPLFARLPAKPAE